MPCLWSKPHFTDTKKIRWAAVCPHVICISLKLKQQRTLSGLILQWWNRHCPLRMSAQTHNAQWIIVICSVHILSPSIYISWQNAPLATFSLGFFSDPWMGGSILLHCHKNKDFFLMCKGKTFAFLEGRFCLTELFRWGTEHAYLQHTHVCPSDLYHVQMIMMRSDGQLTSAYADQWLIICRFKMKISLVPATLPACLVWKKRLDSCQWFQTTWEKNKSTCNLTAEIYPHIPVPRREKNMSKQKLVLSKFKDSATIKGTADIDSWNC